MKKPGKGEKRISYVVTVIATTDACQTRAVDTRTKYILNHACEKFLPAHVTVESIVKQYKPRNTTKRGKKA